MSKLFFNSSAQLARPKTLFGADGQATDGENVGGKSLNVPAPDVDLLALVEPATLVIWKLAVYDAHLDQ